MVLPIYIIGQPVLRKEAEPVESDSPELQTLIDDMVHTLHGASGVGLAAPQVGRAIRLFIVDLSNTIDDDDDPSRYPPQPMVFINPEITWESDETSEYEEGCLSIPDLRERVTRPASVRIRFLDRNFAEQEILADEFLARVVQHELDHLDGVMFVDHISAFRRRILQRRLKEIARGNCETDYPVSTVSHRNKREGSPPVY